MTHHEGAHQGRRLLLVGVAVLVVSSGIARTAATPPRPPVTQREIGTVTLLCAKGSGRVTTPAECRVVIHTPLR